MKPSSISKKVVDVMLIKVQNNVLGTEAYKLELKVILLDLNQALLRDCTDPAILQLVVGRLEQVSSQVPGRWRNIGFTVISNPGN